MKDKNIEEIAQEARGLLEKIVVPKGYKLNFHTIIISDPNVWYEYKNRLFYKVVEERGVIRELVVAKTREEMCDYFIYEAIKEYAYC